MMPRTIKNIFLFRGVFVGALLLFYFLAMKRAVSMSIPAGARTLYTGYVKIEPISFPDIKAKLEAQGCHPNDYRGEEANPCRYQEAPVSFENKTGITIHPDGFGFGPLSFSLTEDKLWDTKDIPGPPDPTKFKEEVRKDVRALGNIVKIKENSWKITETKYPWTVLY